MKQLLKAILPKPILRSALFSWDAVRLAFVPRQIFCPTHLRRDGRTEVAAILGDEGVAETWHRDHEAIKSVFGDDDRFNGVNPGDRRALYYLIRALKPERVLEVGTHIGASSLYIARALKTNGNRSRATTVDILDVNDSVKGPWKQIGLCMSPKEFAGQLECLNQIDFVEENALDYMRLTSEMFDFIFLDGDHSSRTVYQEIKAALDILKPDGVIVLHDYYPNAKPLFPNDNVIIGPFRALARILRESSAIRVIPLGHLPWLTKQGSTMTSLALVTRIASS